MFINACLLFFKEWVELQDDDSSQNTQVKENRLLFSYLGTLALNLAYNNNLLVFHSRISPPLAKKFRCSFATPGKDQTKVENFPATWKSRTYFPSNEWVFHTRNNQVENGI
jgi:hypothetical protein